MKLILILTSLEVVAFSDFCLLPKFPQYESQKRNVSRNIIKRWLQAVNGFCFVPHTYVSNERRKESADAFSAQMYD